MASCHGASSNGIKLFGVWLEKSDSINVSQEISTRSDKSSNDASNRPKKWPQEEHRQFLIGLQKLGKGNWKEISRKFVLTRTPIQVASHAQKYYVRQAGNNGRKRRNSPFDLQVDHINFSAEESRDNKRCVNLRSNNGEEASSNLGSISDYTTAFDIINPKP